MTISHFLRVDDHIFYNNVYCSNMNVTCSNTLLNINESRVACREYSFVMDNISIRLFENYAPVMAQACTYNGVLLI